MADDPKQSPKKPERVGVKFDPEITEHTPIYYCNYIRIAHSEHEFVLTIFQAPTVPNKNQLELAKQGRPVPLEPLAQILMPAKVGSRLIDALAKQKEKYEAQFGSLGKPKE